MEVTTIASFYKKVMLSFLSAPYYTRYDANTDNQESQNSQISIWYAGD